MAKYDTDYDGFLNVKELRELFLTDDAKPDIAMVNAVTKAIRVQKVKKRELEVILIKNT